MQVRTFADASSFLAAAEPWLLERVTENNLVLGIATNARSSPGYYGTEPWSALVLDGKRPVLAAVRTPPRPVVMSLGALEAVPALVAAVRADQPDNPGVIGPRQLAEAFAMTWAGEGWRQAMAIRAYELTDILPDPRRPAGVLRPVSPAEAPLLARWIDGFHHDAHLRPDTPAVELARRMMQGARVFFFEVDGRPVATVAGSGDIPGAARIGMVYTPPPLRGHGYGSAATALLSARLLEGGARACFLFTDLANPTSNAIYQRIGYRPVCDWADLLFEGGGGVQ
jgi:RimJ/RimL family protein N-acetyltransferase